MNEQRIDYPGKPGYVRYKSAGDGKVEHIHDVQAIELNSHSVYVFTENACTIINWNNVTSLTFERPHETPEDDNTDRETIEL